MDPKFFGRRKLKSEGKSTESKDDSLGSAKRSPSVGLATSGTLSASASEKSTPEHIDLENPEFDVEQRATKRVRVTLPSVDQGSPVLPNQGLIVSSSQAAGSSGLQPPLAPKSHQKLDLLFNSVTREKWDKFSTEQLMAKFKGIRDNAIRECHFFEMALLALADRGELLSELKDLREFKEKFAAEHELVKKSKTELEVACTGLRTQLSEAIKYRTEAEEAKKEADTKLQASELREEDLRKERDQFKKNHEESDLRVAELELAIEELKKDITAREKAAEEMEDKYDAYGQQIRGFVLDQVSFYNPGVELADLEKISIFHFVEDDQLCTYNADGEKIILQPKLPSATSTNADGDKEPTSPPAS